MNNGELDKHLHFASRLGICYYDNMIEMAGDSNLNTATIMWLDFDLAAGLQWQKFKIVRLNNINKKLRLKWYGRHAVKMTG